MAEKNMRRNKIIIILVAVFLVLVDQLIKYVVISNMQPYDTIPIIKNVLHITFVLNDGAAFSMLSGQAWILCGVTSLFIIGILIYFFKSSTNHIPTLWTLGLVVSGGVGNLIDRFFRGDTLFYGKVVDYIDFRLINFAVFNFADCCVVVGGVVLVLIYIYEAHKESKMKKIGETANE